MLVMIAIAAAAGSAVVAQYALRTSAAYDGIS